MANQYLDLIGVKYPGVWASAFGPEYADITVEVGSLPLPSKDQLDADIVAQAKIDVGAKISDYRDTWGQDYFTWNGMQFNCDPTSRSNLSGACIMVLLNGGVLPPGFIWRDYHNINRTVTGPDIAGMGVQMLKFVSTVYGVSWYHKANIEALTDVASVQAYDYSVGWPSKDVQI